MNDPSGKMVNALYGFGLLLIKMLKEIAPDYVIATFDLPGPTFRHEAFEDYKIHRAKAPQELYDQIPLTKEMLRVFGIPFLEQPGYEADDLIGSLTQRFKREKDIQVIILSGDLDTLQLVDNNKAVVYTLKKGLSDTVIYNENSVKERFGLSPNQLADYRGLKGDPSDNIPGVPGIGEKTAIELLKEFGTLEELYSFLKKPKVKKEVKVLSENLKKKLLEFEDQAFFSKQLAVIIKDLTIELSLEDADWKTHFDIKKVSDFLKNHSFNSLLKRLSEFNFDQKTNQELFFQDSEFAGTVTEEIENQDRFSEFLKILSKEKEVSFWMSSDRGQIFLAFNDSHLYVVPMALMVSQKTKTDLFGGGALKISHNLKDFLYKFTPPLSLRAGFTSLSDLDDKIFQGKGLFDTALAGWLLNSDLREPKLENLYFNEFGSSLPTDERFYPIAILRLYKSQREKLENLGLIKILENIEMPLIPILIEMEQRGIRIDQSALGKLKGEANSSLEKLEKQIYEYAGVEFNINSPQQLSEILFERLKLKGRIRKTPGGALSTAAPELEKLRDTHPLIPLVLDYRELQKLKTTYIDPFPNLINPADNRIHTTYIQTGTVTGRLSSQDPNLQNIPVRTKLGQEFRRAFVAEKGYNFLSLDYSQIELRVVAHLSDDEKMITAFKRGEDIHIRTASEVFNVKPEQVSANMRREAKILNFGIIYGMGIRAFVQNTGLSQEKAKEFMQNYFSEFKGVADFISSTKQEAHENGYVKTLLGRRRQLLELYSSMIEVARQAERMAVNMPIQGTAADIMKLAMIEVRKYVYKNLDLNQARMLLQVHDEILFEIKEELTSKLALELKKIMEGVYKLKVPLVVDAKVGKNWGQMEIL